MAEEDIETTEQDSKPEGKTTEKKAEIKTDGKKGFGKKLRKIPKDFIFSPAGVIFIFLALLFEILDLLLPGGALTIEIIPDAILAIYLAITTKISFVGLIIPFLIERIPIISDISPTWIIKLFGIF